MTITRYKLPNCSDSGLLFSRRGHTKLGLTSPRSRLSVAHPPYVAGVRTYTGVDYSGQTRQGYIVKIDGRGMPVWISDLGYPGLELGLSVASVAYWSEDDLVLCSGLRTATPPGAFALHGEDGSLAWSVNPFPSSSYDVSHVWAGETSIFIGASGISFGSVFSIVGRYAPNGALLDSRSFGSFRADQVIEHGGYVVYSGLWSTSSPSFGISCYCFDLSGSVVWRLQDSQTASTGGFTTTALEGDTVWVLFRGSSDWRVLGSSGIIDEGDGVNFINLLRIDIPTGQVLARYNTLSLVSGLGSIVVDDEGHAYMGSLPVRNPFSTYYIHRVYKIDLSNFEIVGAFYSYCHTPGNTSIPVNIAYRDGYILAGPTMSTAEGHFVSNFPPDVPGDGDSGDWNSVYAVFCNP